MRTHKTAAKLTLSARLYSREAAAFAARALERGASVAVGEVRGGKYGVEIDASDPERAAAEFLNEALNQQCRLDLEAWNSGMAELITVKALLSASVRAGACGKKRSGRK